MFRKVEKKSVNELNYPVSPSHIMIFDLDKHLVNSMTEKIKLCIDRNLTVDNNISVYAKSTKNNLYSEDEMRVLLDAILCGSKMFHMDLEDSINGNYHIRITSMWGSRYESEDFSVPHHHWPASLGYVYFVDSPKDAPSLDFTGTDFSVNTEKGKLVLFSSHITHEVKPKKFDGYRYIVAGHIFLLA
jgi:hypothetical protein